MKNNQTILVFVALILAGSVIACNMFGGSNSNVANNSNNSIPTNANTAAVPAADNAPMLSAPKLVEMLMADTAGLNERLKDKEIIVIGEVSGTFNGIQFTGGPLRTIYCTMAPDDPGIPDEKWQKLNNLVNSYPKPTRMPIVEARGVFTSGTFSQIKGIREVSIFLDKCTIVSIKE